MSNKSFHTTEFSAGSFSDYVSKYRYFNFNDDTPVHLNPDGHFELIFQLKGNFLQRSHSSNAWASRPQQFIGGLHNASFIIKPEEKDATLISVQLKPEFARNFILDKLNTYKNKLVGFDDLFGRKETTCLGDLDPQRSIHDNVRQIEHFLQSIYTERQTTIIGTSLNKIVRCNGFINVHELAQSACLSPAQFRKRFNEEIGMSPKEYSKIVRFRYVTEFLRINPSTKLTELAHVLGYFDQAHFIKDFQSVTGFSPRKFKLQFLEQ